MKGLMTSFFGILALGLVALVTFAIGSGTNNIAAVATVVHFVSLVALYFAPTYVANTRSHPSRTGICSQRASRVDGSGMGDCSCLGLWGRREAN